MVTDVVMAHKHAPGVSLGAFGSQNLNGTDHWVRVAVRTDASCQSSDICNTKDNHNAGIALILDQQHHYAVANNLDSAICVAMLDKLLFLDKRDGVKSKSRSVLMAGKFVMVVDVLTSPEWTRLCLAASAWQTPKL